MTAHSAPNPAVTAPGAPDRSPSRRRIRRTAGPATAFVAILVTVPAVLGELTSAVVAAGFVLATLIVAGFYAFTAMARPLGRLTAAAAMSVIGAGVTGAWTALAPNCPDSVDVGRCTTSEIGTWMFIGALTPAGYILLVGIPLIVLGFLAAASRAGVDAARAVARARREAPRDPELPAPK